MNASHHARVWGRVAEKLHEIAEDGKANAPSEVSRMLALALFAQTVALAYRESEIG
jgi:hypothetical protein